ncbi:MAG: hypothetical protein HY900_38250 [Deltaproteobacteria bacterium]|nr:hypothetical protein [Deltaproteobacteria bacterium]
MFYTELFRRLGERRVRYLVAGGVALNLHGVPRMTADLDLILALEPENLEAALGVMEEMGFVPSVPVPARELLVPENRERWILEKHLIAFPFHNPARPYEAVDFLIGLPVDFGALWSRRHEIALGDVALPVLGLDDLIALKEVSGREQDRADRDALLRLKRSHEP